MDETDKDRVIISAERRRDRPQTVAFKGLPQARKTISSVAESSKGSVYGYISHGRILQYALTTFRWKACCKGQRKRTRLNR